MPGAGNSAWHRAGAPDGAQGLLPEQPVVVPPPRGPQGSPSPLLQDTLPGGSTAWLSPGPQGGSSALSNHRAEALPRHTCVSPVAKARGGAVKSPLSPVRTHVSLPDPQDPQPGPSAQILTADCPPPPIRTALQPPHACQLLTPQAAWASVRHRGRTLRVPGRVSLSAHERSYLPG